MAGEWIKVRTNLWDDPRVSQLCDLTSSPEAMVVGGLYWLWSAADEHTETGLMTGLSIGAIDRKTGIKGFGAALVSIGWIEDTAEGIFIARFGEHNGTSAKTRAQTAKRVSNHKGNAKVTQEALPEQQITVSDALPREEKIREEIKPKAKSRADASASRLPADWTPTDGDAEYCRTRRPDLLLNEVAERFRDYWIAVPGVKGRKLDWNATWRTWVGNERRGQSHGPPIYQTPTEKQKSWADRITGKTRNDRTPDLIDINDRPP